MYIILMWIIAGIFFMEWKISHWSVSLDRFIIWNVISYITAETTTLYYSIIWNANVSHFYSTIYISSCNASKSQSHKFKKFAKVDDVV